MFAFALGASAVVGCSSTSTPADTTGLNGDAGGVGGTASLTGTYGTESIKPVVSAYWIGSPNDQAESGGGPFVYLFSGPVTCNDLSKAGNWIDGLPAGTQALELIIGTTTKGSMAAASPHAGANVAEVNYFFGGNTTEARATAGGVTLTAYTAAASVDGTIDATFPSGAVKGTFHAIWCPGGHER